MNADTNAPTLIESRSARMTLALIAGATKLLYKTLRVHATKETRRILAEKSSSAMFSWHETISMLPYVNTYLRKRNQMTGLMSPSKDGAYLAYFFEFFGVESIRGSSNKNGGKSAVNLIRNLRKGGNICITPDGPRGPRHSVAGGMFTICGKATNSRMIFLKITFDHSWKFKSWDKFNIPKPFSKITIEATEYANLAAFSASAVERNLTNEEYCGNLLGATI